MAVMTLLMLSIVSASPGLIHAQDQPVVDQPIILRPFGPQHDDLFGYHFDPDYVPSYCRGMKSSYSISTTGVTVSVGSWLGPMMALRTTGNWLLQIGVLLNKDGGTLNWNIFWAFFDQYNNYLSGSLGRISATTYPSLSGTYYIQYLTSINGWRGYVYVSQTGATYTKDYSFAGGSYVNPSNNDWFTIETIYQQQGITFGTNFQWTLTNPQFFVSGAWQNWNVQSGGYRYLYTRITFQPSKPGNTVGVWELSTPGVKIYIGSSRPDGYLVYWRV
jgi:hypothetical protein